MGSEDGCVARTQEELDATLDALRVQVDELFVKLGICRNCHRHKEDHVGTELKCLFEATNFSLKQTWP